MASIPPAGKVKRMPPESAASKAFTTLGLGLKSSHFSGGRMRASQIPNLAHNARGLPRVISAMTSRVWICNIVNVSMRWRD